MLVFRHCLHASPSLEMMSLPPQMVATLQKTVHHSTFSTLTLCNANSEKVLEHKAARVVSKADSPRGALRLRTCSLVKDVPEEEFRGRHATSCGNHGRN